MRYKRLAFLFVVAIMLITMVPAVLTVSIKLYETHRDSSGTFDNSASYAAQVFTIGTVGDNENFEPSSIQLRGQRTGVADHIDLWIVDANVSGIPTGSVALANATIDTAVFGTGSPNEANFTFNITTSTLRKGGNYSIVIERQTGAQYVVFRSSAGDGYPGGSRFNSADSSSWSIQVTDMWFDIYGLIRPFNITLNSPTNTLAFNSSNQDFNATITPITGENITNATLFIWKSDGSVFNDTLTNTVGGEGVANSTIFSVVNLPVESFIWNVLACGTNVTEEVCEFSENNFTFATGFTVNSQAFELNASETDEQNFAINITFDLGRVDFISADLIYNGTRHSGTQIGSGDTLAFNISIDIPLILSTDESEVKNFNWEVSLTEGSTQTVFNLTEQQQNISRIHLEQCGGAFTVQTLNFTAYDELDSSRINPFYFAGDFEFWSGSGTTRRSNSFSSAASAEVNLCLSPVDRNLTIDGQVEYSDVVNSSVYNTRNYFFQGEKITNASEDIFLFSLKSDDSTSFILKVQDTNLLPVVGALITTQRFNVGTGNFTTVAISKTDDNGQTVGFFKTETIDYRFIITKNGVNLLTTGTQKVIPETAPFTLTFTVGADEGAPWTRFEDLPNLTSTLVFNSTTSNVTFSYFDTSDSFTLGRLLVTSNNLSGFSKTICDINSSSSSATLVCGVGNVTGTYTASAFITRGSDIFLVKQIIFKIETFSSVAGLLGVFLAWFIILISAFAFKFNEIAGIVLMNLTVIFVNLIGLVNFGFLFIFGMMGVSILIIVQLKK